MYRHVKKVHRQSNKKSDSSVEFYSDFSLKLLDGENEQLQQEQPQLLSGHCINQLDTVTLLTGWFLYSFSKVFILYKVF